VEELSYFGTTLTDQYSIQEEIKNKLKLGNACSHSVQNLLSSSLLPKNIKINVYRYTILHVVFYRCETWLLTLKEHQLRLFENGALRRIFGPKKNKVRGEWRKPHNKECNDFYSSPKNYSYVQIKKNEMGGAVACKE